MSIYQEIILEHYRHPRNFGTIPHHTATVNVINAVCGDKMRLDIIMKDEKIDDIKFSGEGCAIFLASASLLTENSKGKNKKDLIDLTKEDVIQLLGIPLSPNRLKCALLPLEALQKILAMK